jgi:chemotaxis protein methyltransferase CheR
VSETAGTEAGYTTVLRWFGARTGLAFRPDQRQKARHAIRCVMDSLGVADLHDFARRLEHDPRALDELIVKLTVPETYFFREPAQFDYIRREILPEIRQRLGADRSIRIWSAGCASGEEAYSLAMLCAQQGLARQTQILATDISPLALEKAREGVYGEWSLRGPSASAAAAREYLHAYGDGYRPAPAVRRLVRFELLNLALDVYPSFVTGTVALDLILCRNVLIYLARETISEVARRLYDSLAPGGWLITGGGDPSVETYADFASIVTPVGVFYRRPLKPTISRVLPVPPAFVAGAAGKWAAESAGECAAECDTIGDGLEADDTAIRGMPAANAARPATDIAAAEFLHQAAAALLCGDYREVVRRTEQYENDPSACVLHIKALANLEPQLALQAAAESAGRHALCPELHYLHAVLLMEFNRDAEAVQAVRRAVFLDRSLAIAHFTLGAILQRRGSWRDAQRHFRNARDLCAARPPDEIVPLTDGEPAGQLASAAAVQMHTIEAAIGRRS